MQNEICEISIACLTFNHESFIDTAVKSFLNQKTKIKYHIFIFDGGSKDKTRKILLDYKEQYPDKISLIFPEIDPGATESFYSLLDLCTGKYIAVCEGDDYWTDEYKLQKQYQLLEENRDIGLVHSNLDYLYHETNELLPCINDINHCSFEKYNNDQDNTLVEEIIFGKYIIRTPTVMIRSALYGLIRVKMGSFVCKGILMGDTPLWVEFSKLSKLYYIQDSTAVYRINKGSVSNPTTLEQQIRFKLSSMEFRLYYSLNNKLSNKLKSKIERSYCIYYELYKCYNLEYESKIPRFRIPYYYKVFVKLFRSFLIKRIIVKIK